MIGQIIRLNKLIRKNRNCVVAALDAGGFFGPCQGIVNLASVCKTLNESDAILIEPGAIEICKEAFLGDDPPILITRLNWNSDYCFQWNYNKSQTVKTISPYIALALGADIGIASLSINTQNESNDAKNIKIFSEIIEEAKKVGLPIIGEIYPPLKKYSEEEFNNTIINSCRIAAELGANAIKTFYIGDRFKEIIESTLVPVLSLGGEKMENDFFSLKQAEKAVMAGAKGVVFGRNLYQSRNPKDFLKALKDVVRGNLSSEEAVDTYGLSK